MEMSGEEMLRNLDEVVKVNDRLNNMSKEELISLIKEIKITCESNRNKEGNPLKNTFNFILRLIKGEL